MIKIDYKFTAKTPLHTGSDENVGTMKTLRRQKMMISPVAFDTNLSEAKRHALILNLLKAVYHSIDKDSLDRSRLMSIWEEFHGKMLSSATASNRFQFLEKLTSAFGIRQIGNDKNGRMERAEESMRLLSDLELLQTVRDQSRYLIMMMRVKKSYDEISEIEDSKSSPIVKNFEMIPAISGNSIRGKMRRIAMYDFLTRVNISALSKSDYHMLFSGGFLNQSTKYEDIKKREDLINACPMLGIFGSAIGNMTITGLLSVGWAYPVCIERNNGDQSFWSFLDIVFQTRYDSSKNEEIVKIQTESKKTKNQSFLFEDDIPGEKESPKGPSMQMKYEYEVFSPGTIFSHGFRFTEIENNPVLTGAFWHSLKLLKENPFICGMWANGASEIDLSEIEVDEKKAKEYTNYIESEKDKIKAFWNA